MKYVIVYLIKGAAKKYHQHLLKTIGPKFGEMYLIRNPIPPHITLKSPFQTDKIKEIEEILERFTSNEKASKLKIDGFGNFKKFVVFLKIKFSKQTTETQKNLLKKLKKIKGLDLNEFDKKHKPHATVAYGNSIKTFNEIWNELEKRRPKYDLKFDNITILKKLKKKWVIHKEFKIL